MKSIPFISVILLLISHAALAAQGTGELSGYLTNRETGEAIRGATIRIEGTASGAITQKGGVFVIRKVPSGRITVVASFVGFETARQMVFIRPGETTTMVMTIAPSLLSRSEVVVSANKRVQAVQDVPISISIVDAKDLSDRSITVLDDALRYVSGISIARDQVNIRGASGFAFGVGSRTAVLIDGFSLLSGDNGDIKFDVMPISDVDHIEVIKGAGSALYGTGALGGVVSMITKEPTDSLSVYGRAYSGPYTMPPYEQWRYRETMPWQYGADMRLANKFGRFSYSLSGGLRSDNSYRDFDGSIRGFGYGKLTWQPTDNQTLRTFVFGTGETRENFIYWRDLQKATRPPVAQNLEERLATSKWAFGADYTNIVSGSTSLLVKYGFFRTNFANTINGVRLDSNYSTAYSHTADAQITARVLESVVVTGGVTARINWVRSDVYNTALQTLFSGYAQAELTVGDAILTGGLRADMEQTASLASQFELSPKVGVTYNVQPDLTLRGSLGRGFRAPTIAERYANIRYGPFNVRPNPGLLSESSWSAEVGLHLTSKSFLLPIDFDVAVFDNELFDLIEPTFALDEPGAPIVFRNLTRARILGAELTVRLLLSTGLAVESGITLMAPRDVTTQSTLKYRNQVLWYSRLLWTISRVFDAQFEYRYQDKVEAIDDRLVLFIPNADARVPLHVLDVRFFANITSKLRLGAIARNLLSYSYTEIPGNLGPTRAILLQAEYR